ncbi:hypothetical protein [Pedobacter sp.]
MKNFITTKIASTLIANGYPLTNLIVSESLNIDGGEIWDKEVAFLNCDIENLTCIMVYFNRPVTFKNCHFNNASFNFSYFQKGLTIEDCIFDKYLDFEAGGHNEIGTPIIIKNNEFREFVNFFDYWFTGEVEITNNKFFKGTNIASKNQYISFDIPPVFKENIGLLNLESECREEER